MKDWMDRNYLDDLRDEARVEARRRPVADDDHPNPSCPPGCPYCAREEAR